MKYEDVSVRVDAEVRVAVFCEECDGQLKIRSVATGTKYNEDAIEIVVEVHKCPAEE